MYRYLGIVMDNNLLSSARILETIGARGRITGSFSQEEVDFLVGILRAGGLKKSLEPEPINEQKIGSVLGADTIRKGQLAIGVSLVAVLAFILIYYRFAGVVACLALLVNLVFIVALMIALGAAVTLPGMAGLVLTVGMSVDANVLIFERIREELNRGAALRMAIRNGFAKATTTIVDANLTTLFTGFVLYAIGTDQVRGFAVTLIFGILTSMYTAIFCSRVIFDIAERRGFLKKFSMMRLLGETRIDFLSKRQVAAIASLLLIVVGLGAVAGRRQGIFDIDFLGGTSITMQLTEPTTDTALREKLDTMFGGLKNKDGSRVQHTLNTVDVQNEPTGTFWKVDCSLDDVDQLKDLLNSNLSLVKFNVSGEASSITEEVYDPRGTGAVEGAQPGSPDDAAGGQPEGPDSKGSPAGASPDPQEGAEKKGGQQAGGEKDEKGAAEKDAAEKGGEKEGASDKSAAETEKKGSEPEKNGAESEKKNGAEPEKQSSRRTDLPDERVLAYAGPVLIAAQDPPETQEPQPASAEKKGDGEKGAVEAKGENEQPSADTKGDSEPPTGSDDSKSDTEKSSATPPGDDPDAAGADPAASAAIAPVMARNASFKVTFRNKGLRAAAVQATGRVDRG